MFVRFLAIYCTQAWWLGILQRSENRADQHHRLALHRQLRTVPPLCLHRHERSAYQLVWACRHVWHFQRWPRVHRHVPHLGKVRQFTISGLIETLTDSLSVVNTISSPKPSRMERRLSSMPPHPRLSQAPTRLCRLETLPDGVKPRDLASPFSLTDSGACTSSLTFPMGLKTDYERNRYADGFSSGKYIYADSSDLYNWTPYKTIPNLSGVVRHGTVLKQ